jgi:hypothetical protein
VTGRAVALTHVPFEDLGSLAEVLAEKLFSVQVVDACTAPLAISRLYPNQAFAVGRHALGLQFHPEVQAAALERWYVGHACELGAARIDVAQLRAASRRHAPPLQEPARRLWRRWLDAAV